MTAQAPYIIQSSAAGKLMNPYYDHDDNICMTVLIII